MFNIRQILQSKPHNPHYLNRYIKFIESIQTQDLSDEYTEMHHIAPKAKDLFPEYKDAPENFIELTARQHIIAHVILWKAYGGSQSMALECMLGNFNSYTNPFLVGRKVPESIKIRYLAKSREDANIEKGKSAKGKATFKDSTGKKFFLSTDDPLIQELDLVGNNQGYKMSEESKEKMTGKRIIHLYYKGSIQKKSIKTNEPNYQEELDSLLKLGWDYDIDEETKAYLREVAIENRKNAVRAASLNSTAMYYPDGTLYGRIPKDSPIVAELGLIHIRSEKQKEQAKEAVLAATAAKLGTNNYNNGLVEIKSREHPGEGWVLGRLPRSEEHHKNQKAAASAAIKGSTTWNDGNRNYRLRPGQTPESHWVRGMAPRKRI